MHFTENDCVESQESSIRTEFQIKNCMKIVNANQLQLKQQNEGGKSLGIS